MKRLEVLRELAHQNNKKILIWVFDGIGGLPHPDKGGKTELEVAQTPHLDAFAQRASTGRTLAYGPGITPGSGPGHLALFGYPNDQIQIGRGVLEVLGSDVCFHRGQRVEGFSLQPGDLAARGNYATHEDRDGVHIITNRRAHKPKTEEAERLSLRLSEQIQIDGVEVFIFPGMEHRFGVVLRGAGLQEGLTETDPQVEGAPEPACEATRPEAASAAAAVNAFVAGAKAALQGAGSRATTVLLRGIAERPAIPTLPEIYGVRAGAVAAYPMYRGIANLVGFDVLGAPKTHREELETLKAHYDDYDLFYFHIKETDSVAHLGDFDGKVGVFEAADPIFGEVLALGWDAVVVTGDHCTPSVLMEHSWHPIPTAIWYPTCLADDSPKLTERHCARGTLGDIEARHLVPLLMAATGKLLKYGA